MNQTVGIQHFPTSRKAVAPLTVQCAGIKGYTSKQEHLHT